MRIQQYEENKYAALNHNPGHMVNLPESPFSQTVILRQHLNRWKYCSMAAK